MVNRKTKRLLLRNAKICAVVVPAVCLALGVYHSASAEDEIEHAPVLVIKTIPIDTSGAESPEHDDADQVKELEEDAGNGGEAECGEDPVSEDEYLLAKIAMAEAEGEDIEGKALVIRTVLNRTRSDSFPDTVEDVLFERTASGGWQFSPMSEGGRWYTTDPNEDCYKAVEMVMDGWDESRGATYFESRSDSEWHRNHLEYLFTHGKHYFYKDSEA